MKATLVRTLAAIVLAAGAYLVGALSYKNDWPPISAYRRVTSVREYSFFANVAARREAACPEAGPRTAVILALGQSNAANVGTGAEPPVRGVTGVTNFFDGRCYDADDPLLGSEGAGRTVWTPLANLLVRDGTFDRVVIAPFAIADTTMADWADKTFFRERLDRVASDLIQHHLPPTHVTWFQGEADNNRKTTSDQYVERFTRFARALRARGITAPIYVSTTSRCQTEPIPAVRDAQHRVLELDGVKAGPDTDTLGYSYRWDGCHLTPEGQAAAARLWADAIRAQGAGGPERPALQRR